MKIFKFIVFNTFLKKPVILACTLLLFFLGNYIIFITARMSLSTYEGYKEVKPLNKAGNLSANVMPGSNAGTISEEDVQEVYDYLTHKKYALLNEGFVVDIPNAYDMNVNVAYVNKDYYDASRQFSLSNGTGLRFDYPLYDDTIPVLIGQGLSKDYPVGSVISVTDPALEKNVKYKVSGILKTNAYHSNFNQISSKQYYNFSVIVPVNDTYIKESPNVGFKLQGLFDIILLDSSKEESDELKNLLKQNLGMDFKFYTEEENNSYYSDTFIGSLKIVALISVILIIILTAMSLLSSLTGIKLMIKDLTINLLTGLSYRRLKHIIYGYYGILFLINLLILFLITAYSRFDAWINKSALSATFGLLALTSTDAMALLTVVAFDVFISLLIVNTIMWHIKKIPISLGVMQ